MSIPVEANTRKAFLAGVTCPAAKRRACGWPRWTALGGLDTVVFAGGIGENAQLSRERIFDGLGFLGIELNRKRNANKAPLISPDAGRVKVRVIQTGAELMIARFITSAPNLYSHRKLRP
jgi:acetate kinase